MDAKEKEGKESFGELLVNGIKTMQKVAEAVEKTVTAAEENKRSVGKNGRKNTKRTMKHRNKGECKACMHNGCPAFQSGVARLGLFREAKV